MYIEDAKRLSVGSEVTDFDVVVTTAGKTQQVDTTKPLKQSKQDWTQKVGLTDTSGHIWAIAHSSSYKPLIRSHPLIVKTANIETFINKGGDEEKRLLITKFERPKGQSEPPPPKDKFEGVLDPMIESILEKYDISPIDALWPLRRKDKGSGQTKTQWIIYHRYCEQIAVKAGIIFDKPEVALSDFETNTVVLLVTGRMKETVEWSYGEASPKTTILPYVWAMAEKRGKDRVILKLAGFHGMVYSDAETTNELPQRNKK